MLDCNDLTTHMRFRCSTTVRAAVDDAQLRITRDYVRLPINRKTAYALEVFVPHLGVDEIHRLFVAQQPQYFLC